LGKLFSRRKIGIEKKEINIMIIQLIIDRFEGKYAVIEYQNTTLIRK
jgi:hypothetical protein